MNEQIIPNNDQFSSASFIDSYHNICICVFYEKNGIVRDYVKYYINALKEIAEKIIVVVNGKITEEGINSLKDEKIEILIRENKGLDFGAWKETIDKIGDVELSKYNNLILTNTTCYGPVYPIQEVFKEMSTRDCDFWGITKHTDENRNVVKFDKKTKIIEHIQSYFLVFSKKVFLSRPFQNFWNNVKLDYNYNKVIGHYEIKLTKYLENNGFKSDSYIKLDYYKELIEQPLLITYELLQKYRLPFVKRKAIVCNEPFLQINNKGQKIIDSLKSNTNYPCDYIYDDILNTYPNSTIIKNLHCEYILSSKSSNIELKNKKIALILHICYEELVDYCLNYAKSMPVGTDLYIISTKKSVLDTCRQYKSNLNDYNITYRLIQNKAEGISAYIIGCADVFENYDYICCMHDIKSQHLSKSFSYNLMEHYFTNNLQSKDYVEKIINIFNTNKYIGMLCPPYISITKENKLRRKISNIKKHIKLLDLNIPFDPQPISPASSMFWIRGAAIKPLFKYKWEDKDFTEKPATTDVIEQCLSSIVQEAGYLSTWIMTEDYAIKCVENPLLFSILNKPAINNFAEKIFSIKYKPNLDGLQKVYTFLGFKIKIKERRI